MPRGPRGERRPADVVGCAVVVGRLSVGLDHDDLKHPSGKIRNGRTGAKASAEKLNPEKRREITKKAAGARWS